MPSVFFCSNIALGTKITHCVLRKYEVYCRAIKYQKKKTKRFSERVRNDF